MAPGKENFRAWAFPPNLGVTQGTSLEQQTRRDPMLRIAKIGLTATALLALWVALLNAELDEFHHTLVLLVSALILPLPGTIGWPG